MVGLNSQDAGSGAQVGGGADQGSSAVVGGHTEVLEDEGTVVKEDVVGVGGEGGAQGGVQGSISGGGKGSAWSSNRR